MSTQAARSIRLTHSSQQRAFRLLELTPEIVELLSSDNAPVYELNCLTLKYKPKLIFFCKTAYISNPLPQTLQPKMPRT